MHASLNILPANQSDIPALLQLVNGAYRGDSSRAGWTTEADLLDGIRITEAGLSDILANPESTLLKAEDESGKLVACVNLELHQDALYLGMLTVDPTLQNSGIGKQLLIAAEHHARNHKRNKIRMTVITVRETLIAWYQRNGYQPTGQVVPFPNDPKFGLPKQELAFMVLEKSISPILQNQ